MKRVIASSEPSVLRDYEHELHTMISNLETEYRLASGSHKKTSIAKAIDHIDKAISAIRNAARINDEE